MPKSITWFFWGSICIWGRISCIHLLKIWPCLVITMRCLTGSKIDGINFKPVEYTVYRWPKFAKYIQQDLQYLFVGPCYILTCTACKGMSIYVWKYVVKPTPHRYKNILRGSNWWTNIWVSITWILIVQQVNSLDIIFFWGHCLYCSTISQFWSWYENEHVFTFLTSLAFHWTIKKCG